MIDLIDVQKTLLDMLFLSVVKNRIRVNYHRKSELKSWFETNKKDFDFDDFDEFCFYVCNTNMKKGEIFCPICGKELSFDIIKRGRKTCSKECCQKYTHNDEWKKAVSENWKNKTKEELKEIKEKNEATMLERYGVRHNWCKGSELREKEEKKWVEKYGCDNPLKSKEVRERIKATKKEKYDDEFFTNRTKAKDTMLKKYGNYFNNSKQIHESWMKKSEEELKEIAGKKKKTSLERYGTECPLQNESVKQKTKKTSLERYGTECPQSSEESLQKKRETNLLKFGETTPLKNETVKEKIRETCLEKYGVEFVSQSPEFQSKIKKLYEYDGLKFNSKYELYFYLYHKEILKNDVQRDFKFEYEFEGEKCFYFCDFKVNDDFFEIKGNHYVKDGKLYFPYRNTDNWEYFQRKWDKKTEVMRQNNIRVILTDSDEMNGIIRKVDEVFTKDFVTLFDVHAEFPYPNEKLTDKSDLGLIHHFHKSIYSAYRKGKMSPVEAWKDKNLVKEIALNRLKYVGHCSPSDIVQGFNVTLKAPKVSTFSPSTAKDLISKYLADCETIADPFSGFSGRLLGAESCDKKYFGFDINVDHVRESNEIINFRNFKNSNIVVRDILSDFEKETYDCLFTCPPYGGKEHWNEKNDEIEKSCDEWIDVCLDKFQCRKYLFVVDETEKYKDFIVEELVKKSHFGERKEQVILINKGERK